MSGFSTPTNPDGAGLVDVLSDVRAFHENDYAWEKLNISNGGSEIAAGRSRRYADAAAQAALFIGQYSTRLSTAEAEVQRLREALATFDSYAFKAARLNDQDHIKGNAIKAHKMLMALAGLIPGYDAKIDAARSTLAPTSAVAEGADAVAEGAGT